MTPPPVFEAGEKTHRDENFPVASWLIRPKYRDAILAFYRFARAADDVADHPQLSEPEKIARLNAFEATLLGRDDAVADAVALREALARDNLAARHPIDLLIAFRQDASKTRYENWGELLHYCRYSAAPVGRFVLDVHGEDPATWPASDGLCTALQIINHLQDCQADYLRLNRVYIPRDSFMQHATAETDLAQAQASPALLGCIRELAQRARALLLSPALSTQVRDGRLALEVRVIEKVALRLLDLLSAQDPLSERVHLTKLQYLSILAKSVTARLFTRAS